PLSGVDQVIGARMFFLGLVGPLFHQEVSSIEDLADGGDGNDNPTILEFIVDTFLSIVCFLPHLDNGLFKFGRSEPGHMLGPSRLICEGSPSLFAISPVPVVIVAPALPHPFTRGPHTDLSSQPQEK